MSENTVKLASKPAKYALSIDPDLVDIEELNAIEKDETSKRRWGWLVLLIGFGGFLLWAFFAPLDAGVPLNGELQVLGDKKTIQHPFGGAVASIEVVEGQRVSAGDLLLTLNPTQSTGEREVLRTQWIGFAAVQSRLRAELSNIEVIKYPAWFEQNDSDNRVKDAVRLQSELFKSRKAGQKSELSAIQENVLALTNSLNDLKSGLSSRKEQLAAFDKRLEGIELMAKSGFLASNRLLEAQADKAQLLSGISDDTARIAQLQGQLAEVKLQYEQTKARFLEESQSRLTEMDGRVAELEERLATANYRADADSIKAPVDGYVANLQVNTIGAVVRPGDAIVDIVPDSNDLEVEARLPTDKVDTVEAGMEVELMFNNLSASNTPKVPGLLKTVAADALMDDRTGMSYYTVKISLPDNYQDYLKGYRLQPGMPVSAFIKEGERSLMVYLFKPLVDRLHLGFTEE